MVTSDYVLDEVITALFRNVAFGSAVLMFRCVCINRIFSDYWRSDSYFISSW